MQNQAQTPSHSDLRRWGWPASRLPFKKKNRSVRDQGELIRVVSTSEALRHGHPQASEPGLPREFAQRPRLSSDPWDCACTQHQLRPREWRAEETNPELHTKGAFTDPLLPPVPDSSKQESYGWEGRGWEETRRKSAGDTLETRSYRASLIQSKQCETQRQEETC